MLIAAIVGLDTISTMDLDTTLRNLPLTEEKITDAVEAICKIDMKDDVIFTVKSIERFVRMIFMVGIVLDWTQYIIQ